MVPNKSVIFPADGPSISAVNDGSLNEQTPCSTIQCVDVWDRTDHISNLISTNGFLFTHYFHPKYPTVHLLYSLGGEMINTGAFELEGCKFELVKPPVNFSILFYSAGRVSAPRPSILSENDA